LYLAFAFSMNDAGQIAAMAIVTSTGEAHAFLATPEPTAAVTAKVAPATARVIRPMPVPESARKLMHRRLALGGWQLQKL
jgi:hypothetical protein